jgi:hypothetical protein
LLLLPLLPASGNRRNPREWQRQHRENVKGKSYHTHMLHNVVQGGGIGIHAGEPEAAAEQGEKEMRW